MNDSDKILGGNLSSVTHEPPVRENNGSAYIGKKY